MLFEDLKDIAACAKLAPAALALMKRMYPICRSLTGRGVRETLALIAESLPLKLHAVASGAAVFDWEVPDEWNIREGWIRDPQGRKIVDFRDSNLHVVSYSIPVRRKMSMQELLPHLHSLPEHPDWIPYRTSYYTRDWGFCLRHRDLVELGEGEYEVCIDSDLAPGELTYGESVFEGQSSDEFLVFTHICHPSLCNDNLTGIVVASQIARWLASQKRRELTYRFVFAPGTIGSIVWLARNESQVDRIRFGLVLGLLGDSAGLTYKRSRRGDASIDRIAAYVLRRLNAGSRIVDFSPYGYDERQLCSPGFNLPIGRLTRSSNGEYPEYHSSADDFNLISESALAESLFACVKIMRIADADRRYENLNPKCEPRLGKRDLYGATGGSGPNQSEYAMLWVLNQSDGTHGMLDIAERSGLPFDEICAAADALVEAGLLRPVGMNRGMSV